MYAQLPESFFTSKENYYGKEMEAIYREELGIGEEKTVYVIDKIGFILKDLLTPYISIMDLRDYVVIPKVLMKMAIGCQLVLPI